MTTPNLTEIETKHFYHQILSQTHKQRIELQSKIINIAFFIILIGSIGTWLWWKRKNRKTKEEQERAKKEIQEYVSQRISETYKEKEQREIYEGIQRATNQEPSLVEAYSSNLITDLPTYESEFQLVHPSYNQI